MKTPFFPRGAHVENAIFSSAGLCPGPQGPTQKGCFNIGLSALTVAGASLCQRRLGTHLIVLREGTKPPKKSGSPVSPRKMSSAPIALTHVGRWEDENRAQLRSVRSHLGREPISA